MKRGFSVSTVILVALLLGVLIMVGKIVNPPSAKDDHDHGDEQAQQQPPAKPMSKEQQAAMQKEQQQRMQAEIKKHQPPAPPKGGAVPRPKDALDPSAWQEHDMGAVSPKAEPEMPMGTPQIARPTDPSAPPTATKK